MEKNYTVFLTNTNCRIGVHSQASGARASVPHSCWRQYFAETIAES